MSTWQMCVECVLHTSAYLCQPYLCKPCPGPWPVLPFAIATLSAWWPWWGIMSLQKGLCCAATFWLCFWNLGLGDASLCLFVVTLQLHSGGTSESEAPNNQPICECDDRCPSGVAALPHCSTASIRNDNMQCQGVAALL